MLGAEPQEAAVFDDVAVEGAEVVLAGTVRVEVLDQFFQSFARGEVHVFGHRRAKVRDATFRPSACRVRRLSGVN